MDSAPTKPAQPPPRRNQPPVSRHKGPACGDPGSGDETEAGRGGLGALKEALEEVHEPRTLRPVLGDEGEEGPVRHPKLRQHPGITSPRRKSARQETVPGLEERVRPRREGVSVGREKMEQR